MLDILDRLLFRGENRPRVLVVGDLILDEYLRGRVARISPEAPVPVLESIHRDTLPGGAANVASNLAALGCDVLVCGALGGDADGEALLRLLADRGIRTHGVIRDQRRPTTHKLRVIATSQQMLRIDREEAADVDPTVTTDALEIVRQSVRDVDGVIVSDYKKGFVNHRLLEGIVGLASEHHRRVVVDPKGNDYQRYRGVDALTPNLTELAEGTARRIDSPTARDAAALHLLEVTGACAMLVTCGREGMVLYQPGAAPHHVPAVAREVFDVTGAGDTVVAVFALGVFNGVELEGAARLANAAASIVVQKLGTATVDREELAARACGVATSEPKIVSWKEAANAFSRARAQGRTVVTTNGCFDLLHPGHITFLERARGYGDLMAVGINSDASVRRLKGPSRPYIDERGRARLVAALACVDYVVIFDEDDPTRLVETLRPDVHVKGEDWPLDEIVERSAVEAGGGRVERAPLAPGWSTSRLLAEIIARNEES
jgi:D-beta-D-heptose 7-phosphate kinase/D-beta-D-heptose 1-phosphate adenosyltransferase